MSAADAAPANFTPLLAKRSKEDIVLVRWCRNMDLLALATGGDQVLIRRLNWQLLATVDVDEPDSKVLLGAAAAEKTPTITALVWRPDGKVLAVGQSDGLVTLFAIDGEEGRRLSSLRRHDAAVTVRSCNPPFVRSAQ
jgi:WD40 repeat protein